MNEINEWEMRKVNEISENKLKNATFACEPTDE